ncbi:uncharacterized protein ISCGN_003082 [Ixodes scapularis]
MESAAACSSVDRNHQPHTANAEEEENDMRMLQDPPSTTGDDEHDMAPWIKVTSRAIRRKTRASLATQTLNLSPPKPALRPSRPVLKPKPPPLPADDFKLAIRPRNGLVLSKVSPIVLSNSIMREAKLRPQEADIKIRVNEQQNILVASTPYQSTASALSKIQKLTIGETTYAIASYGISPDNSCRGVIHSREKEATNEELLEAISAPGYEPLTCRRFGDSDTILITFIGKKVPFLIYVGGVETRCFLYKRTVAYCYVCHQTGHRADVCPYPPDVPTCKDCEALLTAEPHECKPKCSLCSGEHRTASKACPGRFLPPVNRRKEQTSIGRRRPRTPSGQRGDPSSRSSAARSRSRSYPRLTQDRRRRSSRSRSRSKTRGRTPSTQERIETQQSTQAIHKAGGQPLLIMGDFNAAHQLWGYAYSNKREGRPASAAAAAAAAAGPRGNTMAPPKSHAFDVTVPAGTPVNAIIAAAAAIVGPVITSITCMFLPLFVSDETLKKSLEPYGQFLEITHGVYKDNPSVKTGTLYLKMKMKEDNPIPNFARIAGYRVTFDYRGLVRVCRRCKKEGHFRAQCTAEYCSRCAIFGHNGSTCTESCRRCGAGHDTVDCTSRRSYGSVTQETIMDFPPLATRSSSSGMRQEGHEGDSSGAPRQPPPEKALSAATLASEPDQAPTQAATLEGLGYGPWSTAGEEKDGASTDSEALVIDEGAPEDRRTGRLFWNLLVSPRRLAPTPTRMKICVKFPRRRKSLPPRTLKEGDLTAVTVVAVRWVDYLPKSLEKWLREARRTLVLARWKVRTTETRQHVIDELVPENDGLLVFAFISVFQSLCIVTKAGDFLLFDVDTEKGRKVLLRTKDFDPVSEKSLHWDEFGECGGFESRPSCPTI